MTPDRKMTKAKTKLVLDHPFFGALAMRVDYVEDKSHATAWTDGKLIGYNPDFIESLSLNQTVGLLAHEVMHLAMKHQLRRGDREFEIWQQACDLTINDILTDAGFELPPNGLHDASFADQAAERIYDTLYKLAKQTDSGPQPPNPCDGGSDPNQAPAGSDPNGQAPTWGEVRDAMAPDASEKELQQAEEDWDLAVANAYQSAKSIGNIPGNIARMVEEAKAKKVDWRDVLREFMEKNTCKDDYTWMVPNRRYASSEFIMPSLADGEDIPKIVVGVDTSGSVSSEELACYAAEIGSILEDFICDFEVIYCDTKVRHVQHLSHEDMPFKLDARGGGGTKLGPVFEYIKEHSIEAEAIIFFSDMMCYDFGKDPGIPVIWLNTGNQYGRDYALQHGCFGHIVDLQL